jgi:hypothetical protein
VKGREKLSNGAIRAYRGNAIIVKTKEPGMAARVYFVHTLKMSAKL